MTSSTAAPTTAVQFEPPGELARARSWCRRHRLALLLVLVLLVAPLTQFLTGLDDRDYADLVVRAERIAQANGESIVVVTEERHEQWSSGSGPSRTEAERLSASGNRYLADAFAAIRTLEAPSTISPAAEPAGQRCLYWPVVPDEGASVSDATYLLRLCYVGSGSAPYGSSAVSLYWT